MKFKREELINQANDMDLAQLQMYFVKNTIAGRGEAIAGKKQAGLLLVDETLSLISSKDHFISLVENSSEGQVVIFLSRDVVLSGYSDEEI